MTRLIWLTVLTIMLIACTTETSPHVASVIKHYPHDSAASTQGLIVFGDRLLESTGGYGDSSIRQVDLETGRILLNRNLDPDLFGEGLALHNGILYQLTWRSGVVLRYTPDTLAPLDRLQFGIETWGLASDGQHLVISDGSEILRFVEPRSFREIRRIAVRDGNDPVTGLNELEFVEGLLFANVFPTKQAVVVDPATGAVVCKLDLSHLAKEMADEARIGVPNGIAYEAATGRLFVTGKHWPRLYEITRPSCDGTDP